MTPPVSRLPAFAVRTFPQSRVSTHYKTTHYKTLMQPHLDALHKNAQLRHQTFFETSSTSQTSWRRRHT